MQPTWAKSMCTSSSLLFLKKNEADMPMMNRTLGLPVELNGSVSNAIPF